MNEDQKEQTREIIQELLSKETSKLRERQDQIDNRQTSLERKVSAHSFNEEENILDKQLFSGDFEDYNKSIDNDVRPQLSSKYMNDTLKQLKSDELSFIDNLKKKEMNKKKKTIMDENLETIIDKTINFTSHFIDDFQKYIYKTEISEKTNISDMGFFEKIKLYLLSLIYYVRESDNVIYLGFIFIFISIILFFLTIII